MKKIIAFVWALAITANAQRIEITPPINDPQFGTYHLLAAKQLSNHATAIVIASDVTFTRDVYTAALYDCYAQEQWVVATMPQRFWVAQSFARSENYPCVPSFGFLPQGVTKPLTSTMKAFRWRIGGTIWKLEALPDMPGLREGVRLFKLVPDQTLPLR